MSDEKYFGLWCAPVAGACRHRWVITENDLRCEIDGVEDQDGIKIRRCSIRSSCPTCGAEITVMGRVIPPDVLLRVMDRADGG